MQPESNPPRPQCSLLLFLATPAEEQGLKEVAQSDEFRLPFDRIRAKDSPLREEFRWLGTVGDHRVIAVPPAKTGGRVVMGAVGALGSAARAMRFRSATGAQGIVQLGMAFGIDPRSQQAGDVLVSTALIPYDSRDVRAARSGGFCRIFCSRGYTTDYQAASREPARPALVELFRREQQRGGHGYGVRLGAILSGAARIHCAAYRDELVRSVPAGEDPVIGGEMEAVGLLVASVIDDPVWCVVKGISDFADEHRDAVIGRTRDVACRNAAHFVLSALRRDASINEAPEESTP